ncbi:RsmB/NOP family class I SAM-dependent RNA methyltransferase [Stakelama tenebrarum]|uniref:Methyltransferase domain-containing protein n=1 Tax=Stakelama tenebrarum TaxID=2711215 RepID=A0A6G6Y142_9SPHN|nr:transcription antitermination factor NusB [Sphingosinithalassobacter tenebrarum]QIG78642.1 methyltransferase domain-containing protein [Sphingosinithalassobacter tenebrarum]
MAPPQQKRRPQRAADTPGVPARKAALRLLDAVLRRGLALEAALDHAAEGLEPADRGLAHAIAAEVLRRLPDLDTLIDGATAKPLPHDAKARFVLRIALVQSLALGTPPHAAISTVLPLVDGGPRKLVHGVFGALMRKAVALPEVPALFPPVAKRWRKAWGEPMVAAAARAIAAPPPLDLTMRDPAETQALAEAMGGASLMPGHIRLPAGTAVRELPGYEAGSWWVQDIAASLPARMIGAGAGRVLDLCAAPGGKTLQLAAAGWDVTALDISESRLVRLSENLARTGLAATIVAADALTWEPDAPFDAILLDAPCSATGIFRRHPDVLYRARPAIVSEMAELQTKLLARAADWLRPGGTLVYATCSLEPEEGEAQVAAFLEAREDFALVPPDRAQLPPGVAPDRQGELRMLPTMLADAGALDGFFVASLRRRD